MYKKITLSILLSVLTTIAVSVWADPLSVSNTDTIQTILAANMDKRVTIQTKSGNEMTGTVKAVTEKLTHLSALSGKEFFDAVIINENISAVILRTRTQ